jgi:hypothetical protein
MYYIIYLSAGTNWFDEKELKEILTVCNVNNTRDNITGLLLYGEGNFIQLLEGEESAVQATYQRINFDERHKGITLIASGLLAARNFPEWAMGFKAVDSVSLAPFKGYLDPANKNFLTGKGAHIGTNLLKAFVRTARMGV